MLPAISRGGGGPRDVELILDSGVRRGSDVVIARCLGAQLGRSSAGRRCSGVAAARQAGAASRWLPKIMRSEIDMVLAQIGCRAFDELDASYLWPPMEAVPHRDAAPIGMARAA